MVLSNAVVIVNWQSEDFMSFFSFILSFKFGSFFILWNERCVEGRQLEVPHLGLSSLADLCSKI